jgi:hypothetical protein
VHRIVETQGKSLTLYITIQCNGQKRFRVWGEEYGKRNSKYAEREITVDGSRTIYFSLPISPKQLFVGVKNVANIMDTDFTVSIMEAPPIRYDIDMDSEIEEFVAFAQEFSQTCGNINPSPRGTTFRPKGSNFRIKYFPIIYDYRSGSKLNTPARIGHNSGIIEVAKAKFDRYTIPMRIVILLHEYSHKYRNPKIGLPISSEIGADLNALYIYLGLGYSKIDAICVFAKVFLKAQTEDNMKRMRKIQEYIQRFENQEYAKKL